MAYTYHDWASQDTPELQLSRLNLHIAEVSQNAGQPRVSADGKSRDPDPANTYLKTLMDERERLETRVGRRAGRAYTKVVINDDR